VSEPSAAAHLRHELRTPLNHIIGYGEMLLEEAGSPPGPAADLRAVVGDARAILALINRCLAPGGLDAPGVDLDALGAAVAAPLGHIASAVERLEVGARAMGIEAWVPDLGRIAQAARSLRGLVTPAGDAAALGVTAAPAVSAPARFRGVILVVDDDAGNRDLLARRLAREGYDARMAADDQATLEALRDPASAAVDVVLLDVMMPGLDGYEVLRRMKGDPTLRDIPVLMISALDQVESVARCIELGAEDYLPKPFEPVLLRARIGACLEKKRLRDQEVHHLRELAEWNRTLEGRVAEQVAQLERLGRLRRFFSPQLAEAIVGGDTEDPLRSHRREITVVFLDLRGFTAFAETAEPEELMSLLAEYHAEMGRRVLAHEGTLERFTGDGMMVFFNDPVPVPDAPARAVRMALVMRERVAELSAGWRRRGYDLGMGIGIAQGYATIGAIGFEGRWDYGAIGAVTNLAARLCGEAASGQILVSPRVAAAVEGLARLEPVGPLALKGLARPVSAFDVVGLRDPA
jgi:class 3 adenylate cyclase/ActR/RegA family two-component response regulator